MADRYLFFAEDIFGVQFGVRDQVIVSFEPETGEEEIVGTSLRTWAEKILDDFDTLTGYPIAREWQAEFGALPPGQRLVPKIPFVLGWDYTVENLYALEAATGMRARGELAVQIRDPPDGTKITYHVVE